MKKIICITVILCLAIGIAACGNKDTADKNTAASSETTAQAGQSAEYTMKDVSYVVMTETKNGDMRITDVKKTHDGYSVGLIDATNTGDSSGAMTVNMTKKQYNTQIKGKKTVKCNAKKTVFLVPCNAADQEKFKTTAFEYPYVVTSLKTANANKDIAANKVAKIVLKIVNGKDETEKAKYASSVTSKEDFEQYRKSFAPVN